MTHNNVRIKEKIHILLMEITYNEFKEHFTSQPSCHDEEKYLLHLNSAFRNKKNSKGCRGI